MDKAEQELHDLVVKHKLDIMRKKIREISSISDLEVVIIYAKNRHKGYIGSSDWDILAMLAEQERDNRMLKLITI